MFFDKMKVVEFEILYNLGVPSPRDKNSNDHLLIPKILFNIYIKIHISIFFFFEFVFDAGGPCGPLPID